MRQIAVRTAADAGMAATANAIFIVIAIVLAERIAVNEPGAPAMMPRHAAPRTNG
jgi:hypothetical protein